MRVLNVLLYPTPQSLMFWDMVSLGGYLLLNAVIALTTLLAERKEVAPPHWIKPVILLSIPWAISIHTVTAFLYSGLPGRSLWLTAVLAPRFLASAFASGPALLILLALVLRRVARFDVGREGIQKLSVIVTYAMALNVFLIGVEFFTALYSRIPEEAEHFRYLYLGLDGQARLAPWMWTSAVLAMACVAVFASLWIDKGMGLIVGGFIPSPLGAVTTYTPTWTEWLIVVGIWALGSLMVTVFYKIVISVRATG
jgi:molybdopterin-containing oxidoreductase family membrane subunit